MLILNNNKKLNQTILGFFCFLSTIILFVSFPTVSNAGQQISVTAIGNAPVKNNNTSMARKVAIILARRNAIEHAVGLIINLHKEPSNRRVELKSSGTILNYKILSEGVKGNIYNVKIEATVLFPGTISNKVVPTNDINRKTGVSSYLVKTKLGTINWNKGFVTVTGKGKITAGAVGEVSARRAAVADAYGMALELIETINVDDKNQIKDYISDNEIIAQLKATIKGGQTISEKKLSAANLYTVRLQVPIWGVKGIQRVFVKRILAKNTSSQKKLLSNNKTIEKDKNKSTTMTDKPVIKNNDTTSKNDEEYTGVIVDASKTDAEPGLFPKFESKEGKDVYSAQGADKSAIEKNGMASYVSKPVSNRSNSDWGRYLPGFSNFSSAQLASIGKITLIPVRFGLQSLQLSTEVSTKFKYPRRVGRHPLIIKGIAAKGSKKTTILISQNDAEKLKNSAKLQENLKNCNVVVVLRSEAGGTEGRLPVFFTPSELLACFNLNL